MCSKGVHSSLLMMFSHVIFAVDFFISVVVKRKQLSIAISGKGPFVEYQKAFISEAV